MNYLVKAAALTAFFYWTSFINCTDLDQDTAYLLNCPIETKEDLAFLQKLSNEDGYHIDIFQEKVALLDSESEHTGTIVQLITDVSTADILLSRAGCYEEKGRSGVRKLFLNTEKAVAYSAEHFHVAYHSYDDIKRQLQHYKQKFPHLVKSVHSIGKSQEDRDLNVIHITGAAEGNTKPIVWIMGGQHAREWIATAAVMVFIEQLLTSSSTLLLNYEFAILPLANPDGYEYSRTRNRMWRKNRGKPFAVDLNRNWNHRWCEIGTKRRCLNKHILIIHYLLGSSKNFRLDNYCGPSAASEPEVAAIQAYILSLPTRAIGFDVHSYGQMILRNYGWTSSPSPNELICAPLSNKMVAAMQAVDKIEYTAVRSSGLYPVSGSAEDWMYVKAGMHGFVMELRDKGRHGFQLPASQIIPTGKELFAAVMVALQNL